MVMKILKGLGAAISPGVKRGGTKSGGGSRYYRRNKKDGTVSAVSEQTLAKRGAAAAGAGAGAAGAGATGAALASDDSESTRRRVDRRGRPLKSQTNGKNEAATEKSDNKRQTRRGMRSAPATTTPATKDKNYNVGVSKGGVPFKESFKYHKDKGQKTFTWNGKKYTTEVKGGGKTGTGTTGTGTTGTGKADDKKKKKRRGFLSGVFKKSTDGKTAGERFRDKKAGGGMMKKKGFSQGGPVKKKVPNKKRPIAKSAYAAAMRKRAEEERAEKESNTRNRSRRRLMRKAGGGMMAKKGYAKGGMTKKGYAKGGSVRGKPRGVGAALRGYGKALT